MTAARFDEMRPAQQSGILCNDPQFQTYAAVRSGFPGGQFSQTAAAEYLRNCCNIDSRRDLNTTPAAAAKFQALRTAFDAWRGRIPAQR
jgi:hypothetical protein